MRNPNIKNLVCPFCGQKEFTRKVHPVNGFRLICECGFMSRNSDSPQSILNEVDLFLGMYYQNFNNVNAVSTKSILCCPSCGSDKVAMTSMERRFYIRCKSCTMSTPLGTQKVNITIWNRMFMIVDGQRNKNAK